MSIYKTDAVSYNIAVENLDYNDICDSLAGDQKAFERLVIRYQPRIIRLMWRFSRDRQTCERLVQDVFVEAYFSLKTYKAKAPFEHWLSRIASRVGYRHFKEQDKEKQTLPLPDFDIAAADSQQQDDPEKAAELLYWLLAKLPATDRLALTLVYLEDCSVKDVADKTGWTTPAVKMRLSRARKKLKEIAEKEKISERFEWTL